MSLEYDAQLVGKVLDLQDVKTFRCRAFLPPQDGAWVMNSDPLKVLDASGNRIGFALLRLHPSGLEAEVFLSWNTQERLSLECGDVMYLHPAETFRLYSGTTISKEAFVGFMIKSLSVSSEKKDGACIETQPYLEES